MATEEGRGARPRCAEFPLRLKLNLLTAVEALALVAFIGLAAALVLGQEERTELVALDASSLDLGPGQERWYGVFFQDQHVGFTVTRTSQTEDGSTLHETRSSFRVATFGKLQEVITAGAALSDPQASSASTSSASGDVRLSARGAVEGKQIHMEVNQAGETTALSFDVERPPRVSQSLEALLRNTELRRQAPGSPYFDLTLADGEMELVVESVEVLEGGEEAKLRTEFAGMEPRPDHPRATPSGGSRPWGCPACA